MRPCGAAKRLPRELVDLKTALLRALHDVESGSLEPARASAMARLAAVLLAVDQRGELDPRAIQQVQIVRLAALEPHGVEAGYTEVRDADAIDALQTRTANASTAEPPQGAPG